MKRYLWLASLLLLAAPVRAQRSDTRGFVVNGHLNGTSWTIEDEDREGGGGLGLMLGYGFNQLVTLYVGLDGARIEPDEGESYALGHGDLGVHLNLGRPRQALRPYVDLALSGRTAEAELGPITVTLSGGGLTLGGGLRYFLLPGLGLDAGLKGTFGELTRAEAGDVEEEIEVDATSVRVNLGLSWYPGR